MTLPGSSQLANDRPERAHQVWLQDPWPFYFSCHPANLHKTVQDQDVSKWIIMADQGSDQLLLTLILQQWSGQGKGLERCMRGTCVSSGLGFEYPWLSCLTLSTAQKGNSTYILDNASQPKEFLSPTRWHLATLGHFWWSQLGEQWEECYWALMSRDSNAAEHLTGHRTVHSPRKEFLSLRSAVLRLRNPAPVEEMEA